MTNEEAIKFLKQLYPNGGYTRLDEQRMEAITMAVEALSKPSLPSDVDEASFYAALANHVDPDMLDEDELANFDWFGYYKRTFQTGAEWQAKQNEKHSFEAKVCKSGNVYLKETDKDAISTALQDFNADEKVIVQIKKCDHGT